MKLFGGFGRKCWKIQKRILFKIKCQLKHNAQIRINHSILPNVIISHPTANANVRATAEGLLEANLLSDFYTSVASFPGSIMDRLGGFAPFAEIRRRRFNQNLKFITKTFPFRELGRILSQKTGISHLHRHEIGYFSIDAVYEQIDKKVASVLKKNSEKRINAVYNYEDGSLYSFTEARKLGIKCIYDLPIGYWRTAIKLLENEHLKWPEWSKTLLNFGDSQEKLAKKDKELELSDVIIVASSFTAKSLQEYPGILPPIEIIPYGFPPVSSNRVYTSIHNRRLKLLFVGGLSQRKGIADMFAAIIPLEKHVVLTVVGLKATEDCEALNTALTRHTWIPSLSHADILILMREHDVLLLPSLLEGFGLVITEAMSQGTPVITTDRTAGPDIIRNNENGWLIEAGSTQAIKTAIELLLDKPDTLKSAGKEATKAAELRSWKKYGQEVASAVSKYL
jgi:glycosyltransferase involved in cell wall biosynthesis